MDIGTLRENLSGCIEANKDEIIDIGETIYRTPETGFKEFKTAAFVMEKLDAWGIPYAASKVSGNQGDDGHGREDGTGRRGGADAIVCREHRTTKRGAVRSQSHNVAMMGALKGCSMRALLNHLSGGCTLSQFLPRIHRDCLSYGAARTASSATSAASGAAPARIFDDVDLYFHHSSSNRTESTRLHAQRVCR